MYMQIESTSGRVSRAVKHDHASARQTVSDFMVHSRPYHLTVETQKEIKNNARTDKDNTGGSYSL